MDKSSSAKWPLYGDVVKGELSPTGRGRRSRDEKGNQGVGDILFTNILQLFSIYFFFSITLLYHLYSILFSPTTFTHTHTHDPHPRPTTSTHDPRPTTFSYTPKIPVWNFVNWNGTFRLHRPNPSHSVKLFLYAGYKRAVLGTTILSNGEGHFSSTDQNDKTSQSGPPSKLSPEYSSQTKLKWSIPLDEPTEISGILGWMESAQGLSLSRILRFTPRLHIAY